MHAPVFTAPANDYRSIVDLPVATSVRLSVIVPVHNRTALLARTLAGLAAQDMPTERFEVLVCDDGSTEDVAGTIEGVPGDLQVRHLQQPRDGYGAARARNLGAREATGEVLVFLDADCIPVPSLLHRHASWHERASNVVVVGPRRDVDSSPWTPQAIAAESVDLTAAGGVEQGARLITPGDWRALVYRRTRRLLLGQDGFRAATTANLSVPRWLFEHVSGFDEDFRGWGGEDTELAWRLWNEGCFVAPEDRALALHQIQLDQTDRASHRERTVPLVADLVPSPFYRRQPTPIAVTPKVSWLVHAPTVDSLGSVESWVAEADPADVELVIYGPVAAVGHLAKAAERNPRRTVVANDDPVAAAHLAVSATRGELLAIVDARGQQPAARLARAVRHLSSNPGLTVSRVSYVIGGDRYLRLDELDAIDQALADSGLPICAVARRRELVKQLHGCGNVKEAWQAVLQSRRPDLSITDPLRVGAQVDVASPSVPRARDFLATSFDELGRAAVRGLRSRQARSRKESGTGQNDERIPVAYVGLTGQSNLGDDAVRLAIERLMPWAHVEPEVPGARLLLVGGGTLLNGRRYYQTRMLRQDSPVIERALFGTGVRSPEYWGVTEPMHEWFSFIDHALHASVRGPASVEHLRTLGFDGAIDVIGDPAFSLRPSERVMSVDGRVVVCPVWTSGNLHGGDDAVVFDALAGTIRRLRSAGREVVMLSAFPHDDRYLIELMRAAGAPDLPYVAGYDDVEATLDLLAGSDLVIGERLHAAILAASAGTPFVAVEYRPKVRDFAQSVDQLDAVVRTDDVARLDEVVDTVIAETSQRAALVAAHVERYRALQQAAADSLYAALSHEL